MLDEIKKLSEAVVVGNSAEVKQLAKKLLSKKLSPLKIINQGLIPGMEVVGEKFEKHEYFVPEVLYAGQAMRAGFEILKPKLLKSNAPTIGKLVIGVVKGDIHDLGKNLVAMMMEGNGFEVIDLGNNVNPEEFVQAARKYNPNILGMSTLMTHTMRQMEITIELLKKEKIRERVKIMVGGSPIDQEYANKIEADGHAPEASSAVKRAKELLGVNV